jgi:hypothetical protein
MLLLGDFLITRNNVLTDYRTQGFTEIFIFFLDNQYNIEKMELSVI